MLERVYKGDVPPRWLPIALCRPCTQGKPRGAHRTTAAMSADGRVPSAAGDGWADHSRKEAPSVLPTLTEQEQNTHID